MLSNLGIWRDKTWPDDWTAVTQVFLIFPPIYVDKIFWIS